MAGMLDGIVVLDFTQVIAGPAATRLMAELGAEVIKIELAPDGDLSRGLPVVRDGRSGYFCQHNQGKQSLCLDLRKPQALDVVKRLIAQADVLVENFSPGAIGRLGLDWPTVHALNPALVMCSISAFGQDGPLRELPGFDYIAQAYSGATSMIGDPDGPPALTGLAVGDVGTAMTALAAINGALFQRSRTGEGQYLDISLVDFYLHAHEVNIEAYSLTGEVPHRGGSHHPAVTPLGLFRANDGYVMIVVLQSHWPRLCQAMERPTLMDDARFADNDARMANQAALIALIEDWMASLPDRDAVLARLQAARVPAAPVLSIAEAVSHPHMTGRGSVRAISDPLLGRFTVSGNPIRSSAAPAPSDAVGPVARAPFLGEHNRALLQRRLGLSEAELAALEQAEVLRAEPLPAMP